MKQGLTVSSLSQRFVSENGMIVEALNRVSFAVQPGQIVALLGPSGCGKSSLLNIAAGFEPPASGEVCFDGQPISAPSAERCVVFQSPALFPWLTVRQNVTYGLKRSGMPRDERRQAAETMLAGVGLTGFERHYPHELSGGMQQRVALARAFVLRPALLLMDEPFAALDAQLREQMQQLLYTLWEEHKPTVLFVTHDIDEALKIAHRVIVLTPRPGRVQAAFDVPRPMEAGDARCLQLRQQLREALFAGTQ